MDVRTDFTHIPVCQRGSCELATQTNVQRPCAYGSQSHRNKQLYSWPRQIPANTEVFCYHVSGSRPLALVFLQGANIFFLFLFSSLHLFSIMMTNNELDSQ